MDAGSGDIAGSDMGVGSDMVADSDKAVDSDKVVGSEEAVDSDKVAGLGIAADWAGVPGSLRKVDLSNRLCGEIVRNRCRIGPVQIGRAHV